MLQVGSASQEQLQEALSALFESSTADAKLGAQTMFFRRLCERQRLREGDVPASRLREYGLALAHSFCQARVEDAKHVVPLLEALSCMCQMHMFAEQGDAEHLLQALQHFAVFFQHSEGSSDTSRWCEKARVRPGSVAPLSVVVSSRMNSFRCARWSSSASVWPSMGTLATGIHVYTDKHRAAGAGDRCTHSMACRASA